MASEVDICNLALAHLGDAATVSSINPPEGSIQAAMVERPFVHSLVFMQTYTTSGLVSKTPTKSPWGMMAVFGAVVMVATRLNM